MNTWKTIPIRSRRYELCFETAEVRNIKTKKILKHFISQWGNITYQFDKTTWRTDRLMDITYPYAWISELEEGEEAKSITGFPDFFITTFGRVYSRKSCSFIKAQKQGNYYHSVFLTSPTSYRRRYTIHQLVGRHFLPEWREGLHILHKDETLPYPQIHAIENLWAGTHTENVRDMWSKGRGVSKLHISK